MIPEEFEFGIAKALIAEGYLLARKGWNGKGMFVCKQVPSQIDVETIVPKMQSLPQAAKDEFIRRWNEAEVTGATRLVDSINYNNQMIIVKADNTIDSWVPSSSDIFANDWMLYTTK